MFAEPPQPPIIASMRQDGMDERIARFDIGSAPNAFPANRKVTGHGGCAGARHYLFLSGHRIGDRRKASILVNDKTERLIDGYPSRFVYAGWTDGRFGR